MNTPPPAPPRRRSPYETAQVMVPEIEIAKAVEKAKAELRAEWLMNIDRRAIDAAEAAGRSAQEHSARAVKTSHRRWMTILLVLFALGGASSP